MASLSFSPVTSDFLRPAGGIEHWFGEYLVDVPAGNTKGIDNYLRINWAQIENTNGVFHWDIFDRNVNQAIDNGQKFHFGVLGIAETYNPFGNPGGGALGYPMYLHNEMQAESVKDWIAAGTWVPNWNSPKYLAALDRLNKAIADHIKTTSYKGVSYKNVIGIVDIRGYGNFGEWHVAPWYNNHPSGTLATAATLKAIIDSHVKAFPDNQLVMIMNAIDNGGSTRVPAEVAYHVLTAKNNVGRFGLRRDNWGQQTFDGILMNNSASYNGVSIQSLINEIWKTAPWTGEPSASQQHTTFNGVPYSDLPNQIIKYKASSFGNGNWCGGCINNPATKDAIRAASKVAGYKLILEGGSISDLNSGSAFQVTVNWKNIGIAPIYENWDVFFELRQGSSVLWFGKSLFKPRLFLPGSKSVVDNFTLPALASGSYNMVMIIRDPLGYRKPLPLAISGRAADGSYLLGNVTVATGGIPVNQPPTASAGNDQSITLPINSVTLNGSGVDKDGTISTYLWSKVSGAGGTIEAPTAATTKISGLTEGNYVFRLTVTDNAGAKAADEVSVTVSKEIVIPPEPTKRKAKQILYDDNSIQDIA